MHHYYSFCQFSHIHRFRVENPYVTKTRIYTVKLMYLHRRSLRIDWVRIYLTTFFIDSIAVVDNWSSRVVVRVRYDRVLRVAYIARKVRTDFIEYGLTIHIRHQGLSRERMLYQFRPLTIVDAPI